MRSQGLLNFQILENARTTFSSQKIYMVSSLELSTVVLSKDIGLKLLRRIWESDVKKEPPCHSLLQS